MNFEEAMKKLDGHGLDAVVLMPRVHDSTVLARIFRRDYSHGGFSYSDEEELRKKAKSGDFNKMIVYHRGQKKDVIPLNAESQMWVVKTNRGYYRVPGNPNFTQNKGMATHYRTREGAEHDAQMINNNPSPEWNVDARVEALNAAALNAEVKDSKGNVLKDGDYATATVGALKGKRVEIVSIHSRANIYVQDDNGAVKIIDGAYLVKNSASGVVKNAKFSIGDKAIVQGAFIGYKNYSPVRVTVVDVDGQNITVKEDENGRKHTITDFELAKFNQALYDKMRKISVNAAPRGLTASTKLRLKEDFHDAEGSYKKGSVFPMYAYGGISPKYGTMVVPGRVSTLQIPWEKLEVVNAIHYGVGNKVMHRDSKMRGTIVGKYNDHLWNVKWDAGFTEPASPDDLVFIAMHSKCASNAGHPVAMWNLCGCIVNSTRPQITNPIVKNAIGIEIATNATKTEPEIVAAFRAGCKKSVKKISEGLEELKQHVLSHENLLAGQSAEFQKAIEDILDIAIPVMKIKRL